MVQAADILLALMMTGLLGLIAWTDLDSQKIRNNHVLALLSIALARMGLLGFSTGLWSTVYLSFAASAILFLALFIFWLLGKVGAGDVKLMAVAPLVAGSAYMLAFAIVLLVATLLTVFLIRNPMFLPGPLFRKYTEVMDRKRMVPFGVPISISLVVVIILQFIR